MMTAKSIVSRWLWVVGLGVILAAMLALSGVSTASAGTLPPRPTPGPTPVVVTGQVGQGAAIELRVPSAQSAWWTVVEWQDAQKNWNTVTGWQGIFDEFKSSEGRKLWWVAPADLGTGPFRWAVYSAKGGHLLAASEAFNLPAAPKTKMVVTAAVP